jgi:FkbM family methyltransferase
MQNGFARKLDTAREALRTGGGSAVARLLEKNVKYVVASAVGLKVDGCRFFKESFSAEVWKALVSGEYESSERRALKQYLDPGSAIVELGGGLGVVSCIANSLLRPPRRHLVLEASADSVAIIKENVTRNKCEVEIVNAALAYGCKSVTFWVNSARPYSNALIPVHQGALEVTVLAITLGALLERYPFTGCTLLCDIEGQEYQMVMNELDLISERFSCIMMEMHPRLIGEAKTTEMVAALASRGFQTCEIVSDVYVMTRS